MKVEAVIFDWDGTIVDIDDRELFSVNEALTSIGLKALSRREFITGYYSTPYTNAGSRMLLRKVLVEEELAEKATEFTQKNFPEALSSPSFKKHLSKLTVSNAKVKSKATQNLKSIFCCSTLKKSEI